MTIHDYVGKKILVHLTQGFIENNALLLGGVKGKFYAVLKGVDPGGIWVENPKWTMENATSGEIKSHALLIYAPWGQVESLGVFPDREEFGDGDGEIKVLGFAS